MGRYPKMSVAIDKQHNRTINHFLADTWWYGLTDRILTDEFYRLAQQRKDERFSAIQLIEIGRASCRERV